MSIQTEITRLTNKRNASLSAVAGKGVTVPSGSTMDDLPDLIELIEVDETYSITKSLTNVSSSADDVKVIAGNSFFTALTPASGYTLHEITVTMGGVDITDQVFKPGTGTKVIRSNGTYLASNDALSGYSSVTVNVSGGGGGSTLGTKTITTNGTYEAEDDSLDGYSSVTVNVPTGTARTSADLTASGATVTVPAGLYAEQVSKSVASGSASTPSTTITANPSISVSASGLITATASASQSVTPTVSAGYVSSGTAGTVSVSGSNTQQLTTQAAATIIPTTSAQTAVAAGRYTTGAVTVAAIPSEYIVPSGTKSITENGTGINVSQYASVDVAVPTGGTSMNVQVAQSTTRIANTAYSKTASLTCTTTGTYDVYWDCFRSTTSGTSGSQLHIGGSAYGTANTTFSNHAQNNHLTGVSISANQEVAVYVRSRATNYYAYCGQLTIVQTA